MIEVVTKYTKESLKKYQRFNMVKPGWQRVISIILRIALLIFGIFLVYAYLVTADLTFLIVGLTSIVIAVAPLWMPAMTANAVFKASPALFNKGITVCFWEEHFSVAAMDKPEKAASEIKYAALYKVYELNDFFYLYYQASQAFIIDKRDFTQGSAEELAGLFAQVLPEKKIRRYNKYEDTHAAER